MTSFLLFSLGVFVGVAATAFAYAHLLWPKG